MVFPIREREAKLRCEGEVYTGIVESSWLGLVASPVLVVIRDVGKLQKRRLLGLKWRFFWKKTGKIGGFRLLIS